jgi:hypothetical protein
MSLIEWDEAVRISDEAAIAETQCRFNNSIGCDVDWRSLRAG